MLDPSRAQPPKRTGQSGAYERAEQAPDEVERDESRQEVVDELEVEVCAHVAVVLEGDIGLDVSGFEARAIVVNV